MIIENCVQIWNSILNKESKNVESIGSNETKQIIENLIDTMRYTNLIWLSAVQIWIDKNIFVTEIRKTPTRSWDEVDELKVYINPKIIKYSSKKVVMYEWCWSIINSWLFWPVERPESLITQAYNEKWEKFLLEADWLLARVIQHENDHLKWELFIEKVSDYKKLMNKEEFIKFSNRKK